jgi:hypothetical protein
MRKMFLITAALVALSGHAFAADMAVKAVPVVPGYPFAASGVYWGVGASASAASATVANTGVFSAGAGVDGILGYQWKGGLNFMAVEAIFTYTNLGNSTACAMSAGATNCSVSYQFEIDPRVKLGFPISTIQALLPNLSAAFPALPVLPVSFTAANQTPYLFAGVPIKDVSSNYGLSNGKEWLVQGEAGVGILNQWTNGTAVDISAGCALGNVGFTLGSAAASASTKLGTNCTSRIAVLY